MDRTSTTDRSRTARTSRTAPRRTSSSGTAPAEVRRTPAATATATLEREAPATAEAHPTPTATAPAASGRRRRTAGPRSVQRPRAPRHRMLLLCTAALAAGLLGVLMLNTIISQGAFRQHELEIDLILMAEQEESLARAVQLAEAPLEVERRARELGMVPAAAPVFLRLSDGRILGEPVPAPAPTGPIDFTDAPGLMPTPSASARASADPATGIDPALDPSTGLDATPTPAAGQPAPTAGPEPSATPAASQGGAAGAPTSPTPTPVPTPTTEGATP